MDRKGETSEVLLGKGVGSMLSIEPAQCKNFCTDEEGEKPGKWSCNCAVRMSWEELKSKAGSPTVLQSLEAAQKSVPLEAEPRDA